MRNQWKAYLRLGAAEMMALTVIPAGVIFTPAPRADVALTLDAAGNTLSGYAGDALTFYGEVVNDTPDPISLDYPAYFQVGGDLPGDDTYNLDYGWPDTVDAGQQQRIVRSFFRTDSGNGSRVLQRHSGAGRILCRQYELHVDRRLQRRCSR